MHPMHMLAAGASFWHSADCVRLPLPLIPQSVAAQAVTLGVMLQSRYERTGEMKDLEEAIEAARKAVSSMPDDLVTQPGN